MVRVRKHSRDDGETTDNPLWRSRWHKRRQHAITAESAI